MERCGRANTLVDMNSVSIGVPAYDSTLLSAMSQRVLIGDGAMGTMLQAADLTLDDFLGLEGCNGSSTETRPDVLAHIHRSYFEAGADLVETNTFGCNLSNLGDYDIADRITDLAYRGTAIARGVADEMGKTASGTDRFVLGSIGPGTSCQPGAHDVRGAARRLPAVCDRNARRRCRRHPHRDRQDLLQVKAAAVACRQAMAQVGRHIPILVHVTVRTTGTMLLGSEIGAALTALEPLGIDVIGLNCATGPAEMSEHLRYLSRHARIPVSVMPNAGLPVARSEGGRYPLTRRAGRRAERLHRHRVRAVDGRRLLARRPSTSDRSPMRSPRWSAPRAIRNMNRRRRRCIRRCPSTRTPASW